MKFIVLLALFATAATAEQTKQDRILLDIVGAILDHLKPVGPPEFGPAIDDSISVGPAIVDTYEPISVGPAIVDTYEPISVGPAIVDSYEPISVGPAIVDNVVEPTEVAPAPVPSPVAPVFPFPLTSPLVQVILNINQDKDVSVAGTPIAVDRPVVVAEDVAPIEPTPVIVVDHQPEPVIIGTPILPSPVVVAPEILN